MVVASFGLAAGIAGAFAQAGYPPPAPGMAPPGFSNPTQQHFEILRQQDQQRRDFEASQANQHRIQQQNLDTIRRQQRRQSQELDRIGRDRRDAEGRAAAPMRQVQSARQRRPLTPEERQRIDRATRRPPGGVPSIIIEDRPRRR
jgi:uncharacterized membrane protein YccC